MSSLVYSASIHTAAPPSLPLLPFSLHNATMPIIKSPPMGTSSPLERPIRISSPIEAGPSLLDAKQLPSHLTSALEYVSSRLMRKRLHLTLLVVRKDVQVPQSPSPQSPTRTVSLTASPARSLFSTASSTITSTIRRVSSRGSLSDSSSSSSPTHSRTRWASLPANPKEGKGTAPISPPSPDFPSQCSSPSWSECSAPSQPNPFGISLIHACALTPKAEKILRYYIQRAEKKFSIGSGWLSDYPLSTPITCPATNDLIRRSLTQNSTLFSSEGLTLLALDHVYTFKCHLHTYSRTLSPSDFTLSVDELRRLVLAQQGRRITKGYLMRAYDWLGVSLAALVDVNEGYKVAYGGEQRWGGIEVLDEERKSPPPLKTTFGAEARKIKVPSPIITEGNTGLGGSVRPLTPPWVMRRLTHEGEIRPSAAREVQVGESAQGVDKAVESVFKSDMGSRAKTPDAFVDPATFPEDRGPHRRGATTPNGFEDITPVTKGEWLCLMVGDGWKEAKTVPVVTC